MVDGESKTYGWVLGRLRVLSVCALVGALLVLSRPTPLSVAAGFVFVFAGEILRLWAAGHLRKTVSLITSGPYRYTRNPLYLGRLLIFTGLAIMATLPAYGNWIVLACGYVIFFGYYLPRKERVEPARLRNVHGQHYTAYHDAVPALVPQRTPWTGGSSEGWHSARLLANREHWMLLGVAVATLLLMWRAYALAPAY